MISYEINLICAVVPCEQVIYTEPQEDASFENIREFGEKRGWQVTPTYVLCPDHAGGFDR